MRYRVRAPRVPQPTDVLVMSFTGTARTVAWMSRALSAVVVVTDMHRQMLADGRVRVDVTCHRPGFAGKETRR